MTEWVPAPRKLRIRRKVKRKTPNNNVRLPEDGSLEEGLWGALWYGLFGALGGLGACMTVVPTIFFPGDTMVAGAVIFGTIGFIHARRAPQRGDDWLWPW